MAQPNPIKTQRLYIDGPPCIKCGNGTTLTMIEPADEPDHDRRTFECPMCGHVMRTIVKFKNR